MTRAHFDHIMTLKQKNFYCENTYAKGQWFLKELVDAGYIDYLTTNDWTSTVVYRVYFDTPYPNHEQKAYERFDSYTLQLALKWLEKRVKPEPTQRLEYLRRELRAERISYGELAELADLVPYIEPGDVELLEAAGVPELGGDNE